MRAVKRLVHLHADYHLRHDALEALVQIGADALLYCCSQLPVGRLPPPSPCLDAARSMILQGKDRLLIDVLVAHGWTGQQRWIVLETVRQVQSGLPLLEILTASSFGRIRDVSRWCERTARSSGRAAVRSGCREVLDYMMLGRASQQDVTTESEELLRAAGGTTARDTGETLLRPSDERDDTPQAPVQIEPVRRWFGMFRRRLRRD